MPKTNVICLVPVKNESWILKHFIECARRWADFIIVLDDGSADGSVKVARAYNYVKVLTRTDPRFDEHCRRKLLIDEARQIPGRRLIISLDADEMLSANWSGSPEWDLMVNAEPGTSFLLDLLELLPGLDRCANFSQEYFQARAFVDDGSEYRGTRKGSCKIPLTTGKEIRLKQIKLLHYIYLDPERMFSKHRWYKCFEYIENIRRPWDACITYQDTKIKTYNVPVIPVEPEWISDYKWLDEYRVIRNGSQGSYWWDEEVLRYFDTYGVDRFRKLNIWDVDWNKKASLLGRNGRYDDPRSLYEVLVHGFIERYRAALKYKTGISGRVGNKIAATALRRLGW
jgi:glycosyltransferase involved in cell wall biosynthesis